MDVFLEHILKERKYLIKKKNYNFQIIRFIIRLRKRVYRFSTFHV